MNAIVSHDSSMVASDENAWRLSCLQNFILHLLMSTSSSTSSSSTSASTSSTKY